ncbi:hypothetical protein AXG93_3415s1410 [Marchantia polymorpha subsp. ruderalis]|uniref:Uncharacterized protein n=1 Tax=Marchantia polymorpha subsp. ruderalis TaxID=1480154 RepID=A0A176WG58_MARPO|nr:hypothetical protein AXG93_3415s1410 [Marchantia polymorpha subsp. ruderalis]
MSGSTMKIDKFTRRNSFSLWRIKMQALLKQHDLRNIDEKVVDEYDALILLVFLPLSYENFLQSFIVGKETVSLEEVRSSLHNRELRHNAVDSGSVAEDDVDSENDIVLVAYEHTHHSDVWILDSGASYHMCPTRKLFTTYSCVDEGSVSMANGYVYKVIGIASIRFKTQDGKFCTIKEVRHVPLLNKNLLSLSLLDSKVYSFKVKVGGLNVCKGSDVIWRCVKHGTLYVLQGSTVPGSAAVASVVKDADLTRLCHMRLAHMSERGMQVLSKEDLLGGHKTKSLDFREHCVFGKLHRSKFSKNGVAERMNQTLLEKARCMLSNVGLARRIWYNNKIILSRSIVFDESSMLKAKEKTSDTAEKEVVAEEVEVAKEVDDNEPPTYKAAISGKGIKYKARVVARGLSQREEVDYNEIFSPVVRHTAIKEKEEEKTLPLTGRYIKKMLSRFGMSSAKPIDTPMASNNKLEMYSVQTEEKKEYMSRVPYASAVGSLIMRSMTDYMFTLGGSVVSWKSTLQPTVTLSTTEAEYMALTEAAKELIWLKGLVNDLGLHQDQALVYCDSLSAICLTKDQFHHEKTKHIDVKYHFLSNEKRIQVKKVGIADNPAYMFTNPVPESKFEHCLDLLNIRDH